MTVKELRSVLLGPPEKLNVVVFYDGEEYDITDPSPAQSAFDRYVVEDVSAPGPFQYKIKLKREYLVKEAAV